MRLIEQSVELWKQPEGKIGIHKQIEKAARLCYKSENMITEDSYKGFMNILHTNGHLSPFEHGTVYLITDNWDIAYKYSRNKYSKVVKENPSEDIYYITSNFRVIEENEWRDDLEYLCEPTEFHQRRISVHIITSIGISRELNRHRCHSICEESSRYCNYSKNKFGNELTFIIPNWVNTHVPNKMDEGPNYSDIAWSQAMKKAEDIYLQLIKNGWKPQQAREVLPLSTKTELIHTAFESDWEQFFKLRCSPAAHPMMRDLANKIKELIK